MTIKSVTGILLDGGKITYDTGFTYSSNVAAVNLAQALGKEKLLNYYEKFGFGTKNWN